MNEFDHQPICLKCGYDQSGEIATWETQCPIYGTCTECGHEFQWALVYRILNEWGTSVGWYAEHADSLVGTIRRTLPSFIRLCIPWRFFRDVNHRRAIRLFALAKWLVVLSVVLHVFVSPIGYVAHQVEAHRSYRSLQGHSEIGRMISIQISEISSAFLFPFGYIHTSFDGFFLSTGPFDGYEWQSYMIPAITIFAASFFWVGLLGFVLVIRHEDGRSYRREFMLLGRMLLLSLIPAMVYIQIVRLGFGIHAGTGMTMATDWVPITFIVSVLLMLFWQQSLWTHAVRRYWHIKRSLLINVSGCFLSIIFGIVFTIWIL